MLCLSAPPRDRGIEIVEPALELWVESFLEETLVEPFGDGVAVFADQFGDVAEHPSCGTLLVRGDH